MNNTLLISRLDLQNKSDEKRWIFFTIGGMNTPEISDKLIDVLHNCKIVSANDMVIKYNGVELNINIQQIPDIIKILCKENFSIYEVYQPYNPE